MPRCPPHRAHAVGAPRSFVHPPAAFSCPYIWLQPLSNHHPEEEGCPDSRLQVHYDQQSAGNHFLLQTDGVEGKWQRFRPTRAQSTSLPEHPSDWHRPHQLPAGGWAPSPKQLRAPVPRDSAPSSRASVAGLNSIFSRIFYKPFGTCPEGCRRERCGFASAAPRLRSKETR